MKYLILLLATVLSTTTITNAQSNWVSQGGINADFISVYFLNSEIGWAVGEEAVIYHTTDGGGNWNKQHEQSGYYLTGIHFIDSNTGISVGSSDFSGEAYALITDDGGLNWTEIDFVDLSALAAIQFINSQIIFIAGGTVNNRVFIKSVDGGDTWQELINSTQQNGLLAMHFIDENTGWVAGVSGNVLHTTDGGENWTSQETGTHDTIEGMNFLDAEIGFLIDQNSNVYKTTDSGTNWDVIFDDLELLGRGIFFLTENYGFITGFGSIHETSDGGLTWTEVVNAGFAAMNGLYFPSENIGWAVGSNGRIYRYNAPVTSIDTDFDTPSKISLLLNYPNPFNPTTNITFTLSETSEIQVDIYNSMGQKIANIANSQFHAGTHQIPFDARNLASGTYIYRLTINQNKTISRTMTLLK